MAVFGWMVVVMLAIVFSAGTAVIAFGSMRLTGRLGFEWIVFAVLAGLLWLVTYRTFPFVIAVAP